MGRYSLDTIDAAQHLSVLLGERISPKTLERWRVAGKGAPYVKVGRRVRYAAADLEAYVEECRRVPSQQGRQARA